MIHDAAKQSQQSADFSIRGALPTPGVTMLEASAGTGKTYAIAALVARYVAAGTEIGDLLIITFTVAATGELRKRIRDRLVDCVEQLRHRLTSGITEPAADDVLAVLAEGSPAQVRERIGNLSRAIADFDSATITTTHGFCDAALSELGLAGDAELRPEFETDLSDLARQVASDLYIQWFHAHGDDQPPPILAPLALSLVNKAANQWDAVLAPDPGSQELTDAAALRVGFAQEARDLIGHRKRLSGKMTFSDQIDRLKRAVTDPDRGALARELLGERYPIVLVDEFQDTDTSQWDVLSTAFGGGNCTLLLIGDPKQAIYAFRGADIYAYLAAAETAAQKWSLTRNYRTDEGLVQGLNDVFGTSHLGDESIQYRPVTSAAPVAPGKTRKVPLRIRMTNDQTAGERTKQGKVQKDAGIDLVCQDVAADIVAALQEERAQPREIAVLVGRNRDADQIRAALSSRGVPAVIRGSRSVFSTRAADAIKRLLLSLDRPGSILALRRLAISDLVGWSAPELLRADERRISELNRRVSRWAAELSDVGFSRVFEQVTSEYELLPRLLGREDGERTVTDLDQVAELVHEHETQTGSSASALASWLTERINEADSAAQSDERSRRLESDAEAVQVITIHAAKGLEFDVVYCPFLWCPPYIPKGDDSYYFHEDGRRVLFVGGKEAPGFDSAEESYAAEIRGEGLRQAYVALTRARHELVVWWVGGYDSHRSPLAGIVRHVDALGTEAQLQQIGDSSDLISVEFLLDKPEQSTWQGNDRSDTGSLSLNRLSRDVDTHWGRTSFTGLTSAAHSASVAYRTAEPDVAPVDDERDDAAEDAEIVGVDHDLQPPGWESETDLRARKSLLGQIPGGATFGSFVHSVLEHVDFSAPHLQRELEQETGIALRRWAVTIDEPKVLCAGLQAAIETPLGADLANLRLADVGAADRLDEMDFEYAVAGGNTPTGVFNVTAIKAVLDDQLAGSDPLRGYLPALANPDLDRDVHGFLTGSIDLVLRSADSQGRPRYSVVDYKTNRLGGAELTAWDYRPAAVEQAVFAANYPLQFLLYSVALHRLLSIRLPGYDPAVNLGPVKYLFVRGMLGSDNPILDRQPCGIYTWQPPANVVVALSDAIAAGEQR